MDRKARPGSQSRHHLWPAPVLPLYGGYAGLAYEINEYLKATLGYSYAQTDSNTASRDYKKNTITAGITGEF